MTGPCGLMDKASVSGAEDCGFESHQGRLLLPPTFTRLQTMQGSVVRMQRVRPRGALASHLISSS